MLLSRAAPWPASGAEAEPGRAAGLFAAHPSCRAVASGDERGRLTLFRRDRPPVAVRFDRDDDGARDSDGVRDDGGDRRADGGPVDAVDGALVASALYEWLRATDADGLTAPFAVVCGSRTLQVLPAGPEPASSP
ncbi:hypothetical protein [Streptomyces sp. MST-110588]|uniref:hypothetical protein n=1 Tax=Streptomyces sp. MST-110588 TaxID=2833628 RepID=UPI001F5D80FA|nr:hypothetical protein [Streptomyces sp. MST-110588]UNO43138.1 hypothetical protein KGS77_31135 [Streptomyces sp. MST-110588]